MLLILTVSLSFSPSAFALGRPTHNAHVGGAFSDISGMSSAAGRGPGSATRGGAGGTAGFASFGSPSHATGTPGRSQSAASASSSSSSSAAAALDVLTMASRRDSSRLAHTPFPVQVALDAPAARWGDDLRTGYSDLYSNNNNSASGSAGNANSEPVAQLHHQPAGLSAAALTRAGTAAGAGSDLSARANDLLASPFGSSAFSSNASGSAVTSPSATGASASASASAAAAAAAARMRLMAAAGGAGSNSNSNNTVADFGEEEEEEEDDGSYGRGSGASAAASGTSASTGAFNSKEAFLGAIGLTTATDAVMPQSSNSSSSYSAAAGSAMDNNGDHDDELFNSNYNGNYDNNDGNGDPYENQFGGSDEDAAADATSASAAADDGNVGAPYVAAEDCPLVISPSLDQLGTLSAAALRSVPGFSIAHPTYGRIDWLAPVDLSLSTPLDRVVRIEKHAVEVLTTHESALAAANDDDNANDPDNNASDRELFWAEGLARPAVVTLYGCWPKVKPGQDEADAFQRYVAKLKLTNERAGAEFESYDQQTGAWAFRVESF